MIKLSCFSYKGGAGRTTLAMNIIPFLATKLNATEKTPLILVDMDVDSCGITYFLHLEDYKDIDQYSVQALFGSNGVIPHDDGAEDATDHILFRHLCPVGDYFGHQSRAILCLPAEPGASLGHANSYDGNDNKIRDFVEQCDEFDCCGILFDSAVGDQLTAIWSNRVSDKIICCLRPTEQFREGTSRYFDKFDKSVARNKTIIVIPNVVPTEALDIEGADGVYQYPEYAKEKIIECFRDNRERGDNNYDLSMLNGSFFGVPKIDRFMWRESVLSVAKSITENERKALECYKEIVEVICR